MDGATPAGGRSCCLPSVSYAPAEVSVWGSPEECVAGLRQVIAAGAGMLMLNPVFDDLEHPETFASEIAPKL